MPVQKLDRETRKALMDARSMVDVIIKSDANEADTSSRVERLLENLLHYDIFTHITREYKVHGVGDSDYCDFAIKLEVDGKNKPVALIEVKRVNVDISQKHLKQVSSYAINLGCEWVILTNCREWQLYHISFEQPPQTTLLDSWNLMTDDPAALAAKFEIIGYKNVKRGGLDQLWQKSNVLTPHNILKVIVSESSIGMIRRELKKEAGINLTPEDVVNSLRHLLNETALAELETIKISLNKARVCKPKTTEAPETCAPETPQI
jgi:hypothetical protein